MSRPMAERSGHPEIPWTILLDATVTGEVAVAEVEERLRGAWPAGLGPPPTVSDPGEPMDVSRLAATTFGEEDAPCLVLVAPGPRSRMVVVAHHGTLDGLGLVGVLGAALGRDLGTTARGVSPSATRRAGGGAYAVRRFVEALLRPPARIAPAHPGSEAPGEHLVRTAVDGRVATSALVAAAARAVRRWNARVGAAGDRVVVAVGASSRPGADPGIARSATWFRLPVTDPGAGAVATAMRAASPEPEPSPGLMRAASRTGLSRAIARRTGSTLLVSNLGGLVGGGAVEVVDAAFYPAAHGRSGVSVGAVGVAGRTVIALRARADAFSRPDAEALLAEVGRELGPPGPS